MVLRAVPKIQPTPATTSLPSAVVSLDLPAHKDAVLLIQPGGKIIYANRVIREWLNLSQDGLPNLEHLARQARPSETFLSLCAAPGQARISMQGLMVEATSYSIPHQESRAILLTLRRPDLTVLTQEDSSVSGRALEILTELSRTMTASLSVKATLQAILESVERLVPSDISEITVWDEDQNLLIPYGFVGLPGIDRRLERANRVYRPDEGYSGYLFTHRTPLLIPDIDNFREVRPAVERHNFPMRSFLGVPLLIADEAIGTLELGSLTTDSFSQNDQEILTILSSQAAVALKNALVHEEEAQRVAELTGLAQLAQAVGKIYHTRDLFSHLIDSITPLLDVNILGFLIFDKTQNRLNGEVPFVGIPDHIIHTMYWAEIAPGSPAEKIWQSQEVVVAPNAPEDPKLEALGLASIAQAAGIQNTVLMPLTLGGRALGYLQAANKKDNTPFTEEDLRMLAIVAGQAAPIIENANLIQETRRRAQQAEALRKIAALAGAAATLDEILTFSLAEIARLLRSEYAAIYLLEEDHYELQLHEPSLFNITTTHLDGVIRIPVDDPRYRSTATARQQIITYPVGNDDQPPPPLYRQLFETLQTGSGISVPLVVRDRGIGEMILGSSQENYYKVSDIELAYTAAGQIAGAIERSTLYTQTDESLRRRVEQLTSIARISRELNTSLDLNQLLKLVHDEAIYNTGADCGTILLLDIENANGQQPAIALHIGDKPGETILPFEQTVLQTREALIIEDFSQSNHPPPHHSVGTSMVVPIAYQNDIVGLIHLHARTPHRFDQESIEIAQTLAVQAAIALGNARRYHEQVQRNQQIKRSMETLAKLLETNQALRHEQTIEDALNAIAAGIREATPFDAVLISVYDSHTNALVRTANVGVPTEAIQELQKHRIPWQQIEELLRPEFRIHNSYFIPGDRSPIIPPDIHTVTLLPSEKTGANSNAWQAEDVLFIPLYNGDQTPLGLISVDAPRNGLRPDHVTIDALEIFATQAALTIERHNQINALQTQVDNLLDEVERAHQASETAQAHLPFLLHKDLEQTAALHRLSSRALHIHAALEMIEIVFRQQDREAVFRSLGEEMVARMGLDIVLIAEPSRRGLVLTHSFGRFPNGANPQALLGQRNPLTSSLQSRTPFFIPDLEREEYAQWRNSPLLSSLKTQSFICLPILSATSPDAVEAAVLGIGHTPTTEFTPEDQHIFTLVAQQITLALHNLDILESTRQRLREVDLMLDFSRQLGSLNPQEIMRALVESVLQFVPNADAALIALWDEEQQCLTPHAASGYHDNQQMMEIAYRAGEALPGKVFQSGQALRVDEVDFARDYNLPPKNLLHYREATEGIVPISSLLIPIQAGDKTLGVMVLDNFSTPQAFTDEDMALISSLTQQTGLILENARLFQAAEQRSIQLQTLTDVATTITSDLQVDAIIASLLEHLKKILPFDTGTLWLRQENTLTIRAVMGFEDDEERYGLQVAIEDSRLLKEMITSGQPINVPNVQEDARFPALVEHPRLSWLGIPLITKGDVVGVIALEKKEANAYTLDHVQVATTFASQAAVALENARLFEESMQRTRELNRRTERLDLLNRLSTEFSASLDPVQILELTAEQFHQTIRCSAISALLVDSDGTPHLVAEHPDFQARNTPVDAQLLIDHLQESQGAFITNDVSKEPILAPLRGFLSTRKTHSLLAFLLATGSDTHGLLMIHSDKDGFPSSEIELANTISNQASVALGNARLFARVQDALAETAEQARRLALLNDMSAQLSRAQDIPNIFEIMVDSTAQIVNNASRVSAAMLEPDGEHFTVYALRGEAGNAPAHSQHSLKNAPFIQKAIQEKTAVAVGDAQEKALPNIRSLIIIPLFTRGEVLGTLNVGSKNERAFSESDQNILLQIASLVSATIENKNLLEETQRLTEELEERVRERTQALEIEHQRTQTLLGIITELSASLDLDIVLTRTLELINKIVGAEQSTIMLSHAADMFLLRRASHGYTVPTPTGGQKSKFSANEGLAGWVITHRKAALIPDLREDERWIQPPAAEKFAVEHRSAIGVPLLLGEEALGALLLFHHQPNHFSDDTLDLVQATAKQIAVAINNAQLYSLIRDQAERLGNMLRNQQVESSRLRAILEAVADGVLVTEADGTISLLNASATEILGLDDSQVVSKSLENFIGLFGRAGRVWLDTIRSWSEDASAYRPGETFTEQITLEDGRVVAVSLAPVATRNEFLGTVSIFRDITHQVEVDRLKSEFVATVSHELRTPMTSIRGYVDILLMGAAGPLNEQQINFLKVVQSNTERLNILVNDLLDISRIEAGKITLTFQSVDLLEIANEVATDLQRRSDEEDKQIRIEIERPETAPRATGDPERVRQIFENLIENAYNYTPPGGEIRVRFHTRENFIQIDIQDNGVGIAPDEQKRIFERFYRGEDPLVLATPGTGLGLSIVQHLIELHGGQIWIESQGIPGQGSTFSFTLPAYIPGE